MEVADVKTRELLIMCTQTHIQTQKHTTQRERKDKITVILFYVMVIHQ